MSLWEGLIFEFCIVKWRVLVHSIIVLYTKIGCLSLHAKTQNSLQQAFSLIMPIGGGQMFLGGTIITDIQDRLDSIQIHERITHTLGLISGGEIDEHYMYLNISEARFPFKCNRLRCVRCVNENCKKRKRLRWQAANHGCHCFDRAFLLAGACVCCVKCV